MHVEGEGLWMGRDQNRKRKKIIATAASVDEVYLWRHGTVKHELLTPRGTAEVVSTVTM